MVYKFENKSQNKPLAEFRLRIYWQRQFLRRFYGGSPLLPPTRTSVAATLGLWLAGVGVLLFSPDGLAALRDPGSSILTIFLVASTLTAAATGVAYARHRRRH